MYSLIKRYLEGFLDVILPRTCIVCGRQLVPKENICCTMCTINMPLTNYKACQGNPLERIFWGKIPIVKANAYMHYYPGTLYAQIIRKLKYKNRTNIGIYLGRLTATDLKQTDFFEDIDYIIPIPLAKSRQFSRGYNQSEIIAKGIKQITNIPIDTKSIIRKKANKKQAQTQKINRYENVKDIFKLRIPCTNEEGNPDPIKMLSPTKRTDKTTNHPLENKHILLVDDVTTTGATLLSCGKVLANIPGIRISILCVAIAGHHRWGPRIN